MEEKNSEAYADIIDMEYRKSTKRAHMPIYDRAAQFSPFAALTGYDDAIIETGRITDEKTELEDFERELVNKRLNEIWQEYRDRKTIEIKVTYFVKDLLKSGGSYVVKKSHVKKMNIYDRYILLEDDSRILFENIVKLE